MNPSDALLSLVAELYDQREQAVSRVGALAQELEAVNAELSALKTPEPEKSTEQDTTRASE